MGAASPSSSNTTASKVSNRAAAENSRNAKSNAVKTNNVVRVYANPTQSSNLLGTGAKAGEEAKSSATGVSSKKTTAKSKVGKLWAIVYDYEATHSIYNIQQYTKRTDSSSPPKRIKHRLNDPYLQSN